jgi:integrase
LASIRLLSQQSAHGCGKLVRGLVFLQTLKGFSSHFLRRIAITAAEDAGLSLNAVNELSGHRSLTSLQRYIDGNTAREQAEAARGLLLPEE